MPYWPLCWPAECRKYLFLERDKLKHLGPDVTQPVGMKQESTNASAQAGRRRSLLLHVCRAIVDRAKLH